MSGAIARPLSAELKAAKRDRREQQRLVGRNIALIFEKTSTRTRCAFDAAAHDRGAHCTYLDPAGSQLGQGVHPRHSPRPGPDVRRHRVPRLRQERVEELAAFAGVPVWNGLTNEWHPTQMLADQLTMIEHTGRRLDKISVAYLGDA